ncbi:unnamed protein product [Fusarium graminearum]|uniref:Rhodopsin domain-containing protein n=1 Tax=Gibberella zeae TaxID=5518 RepID=A0A2H3HMK7_GIBZA|nr:hypothetical protein FGRA07_00274 [Fusarium graminearum]CAF3609115.1 unnamed protein product [Fusarium graminearum]CAF3633763.1 unnamed protein product [Fusarium graminearum]CAG1968904.1 unnamed protein product [Fusarium graminearum]CAG1975556.1 unnamed protein product [Fusarium graminearum]
MDPANLPSNPDENGAGAILGGTLFVVTLATIVVLARLYVRIFIIRGTGWDDAFMILTMALNWAGEGVIIASVVYGAGKHIGDVEPDVFQKGMKLNFISQPIFLIAICVVKLSVGFALLRIASTKFYRWLICGIMIFMSIYTIGCFFTVVLQCKDLRALWDPLVPMQCWSQHTLQSLSYTNAALNILTDLFFAVIIPTPMLWNLNVHFRTRVTLIAILGLGVFACAAAIVKVGYVTNYGKVGDWLWDSRNISIWTVVELNVGIIGGSLPCLKPLFRRILGSYYGKGSKKTPITGDSAYGRGTLRSATMRSGKNWHTLSSGHRKDDETSSQEGINNDYELRDRVTSPHGFSNHATVLGNIDVQSSDDECAGDAAYRGAGITKTTTVKISRAGN